MNFDEIIDRTGKGAIKYDWRQELYGDENIIPMWVADMDFKSPQCVIDTLKKTLDYGVLGYHAPTEKFYKAVIKWQKKHHNMTVKKEWLNFVPGVVTAIAVAINAFTKKGDKIVVQPPVYAPFFNYPLRNKRQVLYNSLIEKDGTYVMDYDDLEKHFADGTKMMILCTPHNPAGRVWKKQELIKVSQLAEKYNVVVVADEIHSDLVLNGNDFVSYSTLNKEAANHSLTFIAPSKTFNIAGLSTSVAIIPNDDLRNKWSTKLMDYEMEVSNFLGYEALIAAYEEGEPWRQSVIKYLDENVEFTLAFFENHIHKIKPWRPQASFLMWLDCREMGLNDDDLMRFFVEKAKLGLSSGISFGKKGSGFMRMNIGMPREMLKQALEQLKNAFL